MGLVEIGSEGKQSKVVFPVRDGGNRLRVTSTRWVYPIWGTPGQGGFKINGLALPDNVLEKHYTGERLFSLIRL